MKYLAIQLAKSLLLFLSSWAALAQGGELILDNGDRISGELVRIQGETLIWKSAVFGELKVDTRQVESVTTTAAFKIDGHEAACFWVSVKGGEVQFECDDGDDGVVPLMSLNLVLPHEEYEAGHYTYRGKLALSGRRSSGNKEEELWTMDSETLFRRGDYRHETEIEFDSISKDGDDAESRGRLRYSLDWFFEEKWFWYNNLRVGFDQPANIRENYTYGTGVGYQVWENNTTALSVETGLDYLKERFYTPERPTATFEPSNETAAWRWALDFRYRLPGSAAFFHRHQLVKSLEQSEDWLLETETGVSLPVTGRLFTELKLEYDVDNLPAEGSLRDDKQLTIGVGYSW